MVNEASAAFDRAAARVDYQLSFKRSHELRRFDGTEISSGLIDDAYKSGEDSPGGWCADFPDMTTELGNFQEFFAAAVAEAIHEVCEWFRVDNQMAIDPHAGNEQELIVAAMDFGRALFERYETISQRKAPDEAGA